MTLSTVRLVVAGFAAACVGVRDGNRLGGYGFPSLPATGVGAAIRHVCGAGDVAAFGPAEGGGCGVGGLHEHMQQLGASYGNGGGELSLMTC